MLSVDALVSQLAINRPVFHSEADFQHAFGWRLQRMHPDWLVRLELPLRVSGRPLHVDLLASSARGSVAIELKYKTRSLEIALQDEVFDLANHSAQDCGRYDFIHDISRLERIAAKRTNTKGLAILLTNDPSYWGPAPPRAPIDAGFRLWPGRTLSGALAWSPGAAQGTVRGREAEIPLRGSYHLTWRDYSELDCPRHGVFKYLAVEVPSKG
jgi:hypothetical protein